MEILIEISIWSFIFGMFLVICYGVGKVIFVALYGEQIRQLIINMPEYKPTWFALVGLNKPIKLWQLGRITFFVIRLMGVIFTKQTSIVNEEFKRKLPKKIIIYLKVLDDMGTIAILLIIVSGIILYLNQQ